MARLDGLTLCSSVLPWKSAGDRAPWPVGRHVQKTELTLHELLARLPREDLVWGGDWNHALSGPEYAGSRGGRVALLQAIDTLMLQVPTAPAVGSRRLRGGGRVAALTPLGRSAVVEWRHG